MENLYQRSIQRGSLRDESIFIERLDRNDVNSEYVPFVHIKEVCEIWEEAPYHYILVYSNSNGYSEFYHLFPFKSFQTINDYRGTIQYSYNENMYSGVSFTGQNYIAISRNGLRYQYVIHNIHLHGICEMYRLSSFPITLFDTSRTAWSK